MSQSDYPLTKKEFDQIYGKVPRLTAEIVLIDHDGKVFLTKRSIPPCTGQWHLPGGTVFFGEYVEQAVKRIAKKELGITVGTMDQQGFIEYPSHFENGHDHPVGLVFFVKDYSGEIVIDEEASDSGWFAKLPLPMHGEQDVFLGQHGFTLEK